MLAFTGVRGVVSLAAALAIPLTLANGAPFPHRDLILFVTFGVIIATLVGMGLMLPAIVRWLDLARDGRKEQQQERTAELAARHAAMQRTRQRLDQLAAERQISDDVLGILQDRQDSRRRLIPKDSDGVETALLRAQIATELIGAEREFLYQLLREGKITDESRRRIERELDLEEASIASKIESGSQMPL